MMEEVDRHECMHECRSTVGCLHLATSTLPVGDAMDYVSDNFGAAAATAPLHNLCVYVGHDERSGSEPDIRPT